MSASKLLLPPQLLTFKALPLALQALTIHVFAWGLLWAFLWVGLMGATALFSAPTVDTLYIPLILALAEGALAALLSRLAGLPVWWLVINAVFFPAAITMILMDISPAWYFGGFVLLALTSLGAVVTRVPLYLSSNQAHLEVEKRLPNTPGLSIIDMGSGLGGLLSHLATVRPDSQLNGVDAAPLPWLVSKIRLVGRANIRLGSLWDENLSNYDVVYAYLSPAPMPRLWQKIQKEMRPGSLFISNTFAVPGIEPDETVELHDLSRARLLIWRMQ